MSDDNKKRSAPPYISFQTFLTAIERLEPGLPMQLDRSVWPSFAGSVQAQVLSTFKYLGLIDDNGKVQDALRDLVHKKDHRKDLIKQLLTRCYPEIMQHGLSQLTPKNLDELIRKYGSTDVTHERAVRFFTNAYKYSGETLPPSFTQRTRSKKRQSVAQPRRRQGAETIQTIQDDSSNDQGTDASESAASSTGTEQGSPNPAEIKSIRLRSGGTLTIALNANVFVLSKEDRSFVFSLVDQLLEYEDRGDDTDKSNPTT